MACTRAHTHARAHAHTHTLCQEERKQRRLHQHWEDRDLHYTGMLRTWFSNLSGQRKTVNADHYIEMKSHRSHLQWIPIHTKIRKLSFVHNNAIVQAAQHISIRSAESGWTVLPHPPYRPDLTPLNFHLFQPLKGLHGIILRSQWPIKTLCASGLWTRVAGLTMWNYQPL